LTWDSGSGTFVIWDSELGTGNWNGATAVSGTASGALVLDWGPSVGGGGALAVPQTSAVDNLSTFWPTVTGTYLTMTYGYEYDEGAEAGPVKVVLYSDGEAGAIDVFDYSNRTDGGGSFFGEPIALTRVEDFESGPRDEAISVSFQNVAENNLASSTVVQNTHLCKGAFIAAPSSELIIMVGFDPSGRFFGFTMFQDLGDGYYIVRFGLGVKDENYDDEMVVIPM
jgi:hypothetical protein